jgi:hypothetical protein
MTEEDALLLEQLRKNISGRTRYEGRTERTDEFLLRLLDACMDEIAILQSQTVNRQL